MQISLENILGINKGQETSVPISKEALELGGDFTNLLSETLLVNEEQAGSTVDDILKKIISKETSLEDVKEEFNDFKTEVKLSKLQDEQSSKEEKDTLLSIFGKKDNGEQLTEIKKTDLDNILRISPVDKNSEHQSKNINLNNIIGNKDRKILNIFDSKENSKKGNKIQATKGEVSFADLMNNSKKVNNISVANSSQLESFKNNRSNNSIIDFNAIKERPTEILNNSSEQIINTNITQNPKGDLANLNLNKPMVGAVMNQLALSELEGAELNKVIEKVSDYILQNNTAAKDSIDLSVNHEKLGQFNINVSKMKNADNISIEIMTKSNNAHTFFIQNEKNLFQALTNSGLVVSGMKVGQSEEAMNLASDNNSFSKEFSFSEKSNQSLYGQDREENEDSQRRRELWEMYRERYGA